MYDVIMVSSFSNLKRHWLLFKAMKELKDRGRVITAVLIGYAGSLTKKDLEHQATEYGVLEQVTILEDLTPAQVALYYNRSKLNLLLSKREGFNRSLIEGLYCNIPCFIRDGFNFDYKYPYISEKSGGYYTDTSLASDLSGWLDSYGSFRAKELVAAINMQADEAAKILSRAIFKEDGDCLVSKTSGLHGMEYWTEEEERKFDADYSYLLSCLIKQ
jgi:glycosyltransferase involved in cell wall biosynthesis